MLDRRGVIFCVGLFLAARIGLSLLGWIGIREESDKPEGEAIRPGTTGLAMPAPGRADPAIPGFHNVVDGTTRWDASWFLYLAENDYGTEAHAAYFPAYPLAVRFIASLTPLGSLGAAMLVSNAAFLGALLTLYGLSLREFNEPTARRAVTLLTFFPTSFFFLAPYSESLLLLATVLTFAWARSDRWGPAGVAGAVACATRSIGATLVPSLLVEAWTKGPPRARRLAWALVPAVGLVAYLAWWWARAGDPFVPFDALSKWHREPTFPLISLGRGIAFGLRAIGNTLWLPEAGDVILTVVPLMVFVLGWNRLPSPSYTAYVAAGFLIHLSSTLPARPLIGMSRYVIVLFPIAWIAALRLESSARYRVVLLISILGWTVLSLGFLNWRFIA